MRRLQGSCIFVFVALTLLLLSTGCSTVHRSRIYLDKTSRLSSGMVITNFSIEEVDSFVRYFTQEKGYEIKFAESTDPLVQQELQDEEDSLIWIAEKPDGPTILFISSDKTLSVRIIQISGPIPPSLFREYSHVLYSLLRDKFGQENVRMVK